MKKYGDTAWDWFRIWGEADAGTFVSHGAMDKEILAGKYPISMEDLDYRVNENMIKGTPLTGIWPKDGVAVSAGTGGDHQRGTQSQCSQTFLQLLPVTPKDARPFKRAVPAMPAVKPAS